MAITLGGNAASPTIADNVSTQSTSVFGTQPVSGSTIVVGVGYDKNISEVVSSVTDNASNTYVAIGSLIVFSAFNVQLYYAKNIATVANFQVTATWSANTFAAQLSAAEIKGAHLTAPLDQNNGQSQTAIGTGTDAITSGSVTPTTDGQFVFGFSCRAGGTADVWSPGTGFTGLHSLGGIRMRSEYLIQATAAAVAATFTHDIAGNVVTGVATFKAADVTNVFDSSMRNPLFNTLLRM